MELQMARQTDWNALARGILLIALSGFILKLVAAGHIGWYIHPKFTWFTTAASAGLLLMAYGQLRRGLRGVTGAVAPLRTRLYTAFTVVLCIGFLVPPVTFGADLAHKQGMNITNRGAKVSGGAVPAVAAVTPPEQGSGQQPAPQPTAPAVAETPKSETPKPAAEVPSTPVPTAPAAVPEPPPQSQLPATKPGAVQLENNTAVVTPQNFVPWMNELYSKPQQYAGKRVALDGFIFVPPDAAPEDFAVTRLVVTCHVAHAFPDGLLAVYPGNARPAQDSWFRAEGVLEMIQYRGADTLRIKLDKLTPIAQPADPYIYP